MCYFLSKFDLILFPVLIPQVLSIYLYFLHFWGFKCHHYAINLWHYFVFCLLNSIIFNLFDFIMLLLFMEGSLVHFEQVFVFFHAVFYTLHIHLELFYFLSILFRIKSFCINMALYCFIRGWCYVFLFFNNYLTLVAPVVFRLSRLILLIDILIIIICSIIHIYPIVIHRCTNCLISTFLQNLSKYSHLVSLLSCMNISLKCSISAIKNIFLLLDVILYFWSLFKFHFTMCCYLHLLLQIMVN